MQDMSVLLRLWRLSEFDMHGMSHTIYRLPVHLPDQQNVYFRSGMEEEAVEKAASNETQLTAWFELKRNCEDAKKYLYTEIPSIMSSIRRWVTGDLESKEETRL